MLIKCANEGQSKLQMPSGKNNKTYPEYDIVENDELCFEGCLLYVRPLEAKTNLSFSTGADEFTRMENIHQPAVLVALASINVKFEGKWSLEILPITRVVTLFAFLNYQSKLLIDTCVKLNDDDKKSVLVQSESCFACLLDGQFISFLDMLITGLLIEEDCSMHQLFFFIRNLEAFWVAHFLLSHMLDEEKEIDYHKISTASKIYGLSESYFRKLCHAAFTRGPKKQMRLWRAARSVLQLIELDTQISTVAINNGYASSSHFSSEIKMLFGLTPREFKKLESLLHE